MDELIKDKSKMGPPLRLSNAALSNLPDGIKRPSYDRSKLSPGIVHIGMGNFHRAHQAWYLHRLMEQGLAHDWAIIGAGVRPTDAKMRETLLAQECLTTLVELDPHGTSAEVIGSIIDFVPVEQNNTSLIAAMSDPAIRIVSLTITEGGYYTDAHGDFDPSHDDVCHDIANPDAPVTVFGAMIVALNNRRQAGHPAFTCMCCDNLQNNGEVLRNTLVGLARLIDAELADWIDEDSSFPASMVDCIVPATGPDERDLAQQLGVIDNAVVTHEHFRQWVIEDDFCAGRPPWERVGATLTNDVHPYEAMKILMLNAGHQVLANAGELLGLETIADCMADPDVAAFFMAVERDEIAPHVDPVPGLGPAQYLELISERFANPAIRDTTRRVAFDGSSRHPGFVLPIVRKAIGAGTRYQNLALVEALWCRMCCGVREDGSIIEPNDPNWDDLKRTAMTAEQDPDVWLNQKALYGDLTDHADFRSAFIAGMNRLSKYGVRATLASAVNSSS